VTVLKAALKLVKHADPDTIAHLKLFAKLITLWTDHMAYYSDNVNIEFKKTHALKRVLDKMQEEAVVLFNLP
jgi:predicted nucleic acid-binding protein